MRRVSIAIALLASMASADVRDAEIAMLGEQVATLKAQVAGLRAEVAALKADPNRPAERPADGPKASYVVALYDWSDDWLVDGDALREQVDIRRGQIILPEAESMTAWIERASPSMVGQTVSWTVDVGHVGHHPADYARRKAAVAAGEAARLSALRSPAAKIEAAEAERKRWQAIAQAGGQVAVTATLGRRSAPPIEIYWCQRSAPTVKRGLRIRGRIKSVSVGRGDTLRLSLDLIATDRQQVRD